MVLKSHDLPYRVNICPSCHQEYEPHREHLCPGKFRAQQYDAPPVVANARGGAAQNDSEILEETLDMRFHVEKKEDPHIGKIIADRYCIKSLVGKGGMGMVYKAEQTNIERLVAIKMLHPHIVADADTIKRFHKEAQAVSRVDNAHSVRIYDFGITSEAQPYLVMDFIDGVSLRQVLKQQGVLDLTRASEIFSQVIDALACAHSVGVVHRDMKPENIMLCERGGNTDWVYVVDFGISTLASNQNGFANEAAQQTERRGSPPYMSPEQCTKGAEVGTASDIYSLAIVIYESLSGRLPYHARNTIEMLESHISAVPVPLTHARAELSSCEALAHVLQRSMEKNPEKRQASIDEFGDEFLEAIKRDTIRLNYLKNRRESIFSSTSGLPALVPEAASPASPEAMRNDGATPSLGVPIFQNLHSGAHKKLIESVIGAITGSEESDKPESIQCPHCHEPVEPGIAFCLACGRSLATSQSSGAYGQPRSMDTLSNAIPAFSPKSKQLDSRRALFSRGLLVAGVVLIIAIIWFAGGRMSTKGHSRSAQQSDSP